MRTRTILSAFLLAAVAMSGPGCIAARIDADRGDIATGAVEHDFAPVALTVAVAPFEDRTERGRLPKGEVDAFTRSYARVLGRRRVSLDVFVVPPRSVAPAPAGPADLRVRGAILDADLHTNYAWMSSWLAIATVTFGY